MAEDRSDAFIVRWSPSATHQSPTRHVFEPREDGRYNREEQRYDSVAGEWTKVGSEVVNSVGVENVPADAVDDYEREATPAETRLDDPEWADDQQALGE